MKTYELIATYGSNLTPCTLFAGETRNGLRWYAVEGSTNVNATYDDIEDGCSIEELADVDYFTASAPIGSLDDFENEVQS